MIVYNEQGKEIYIKDEKCPECGNSVWIYSNPIDDSTEGTYCTNDNCKFMENKHMTWECIKKVNRRQIQKNENTVKRAIQKAKRRGFYDVHLTNPYNLKAIFDMVTQEGLKLDSLGEDAFTIYDNEQLKEWENN